MRIVQIALAPLIIATCFLRDGMQSTNARKNVFEPEEGVKHKFNSSLDKQETLNLFRGDIE